MNDKKNSVVYNFDDIRQHLLFLPILNIYDPDQLSCDSSNIKNIHFNINIISSILKPDYKNGSRLITTKQLNVFIND